MNQLNKKMWFCAVMTMLLATSVMALNGAIPAGVYTYNRPMEENAEEIEKPQMEQAEYLTSADRLLGTRVRNMGRESIARVHELIIDDSRDIVHYVVLSSGGNLFPVPWSAFDTEGRRLTLDISRERLNQAPSVKTIDLHQLATSEYRQKAEAFYSEHISAVRMEHGVKSMQPTEAVLCAFRDIRRLDIRNLKDEELASLDDVVIDLRNGAIAYGFASYGGWMGIGEKTAAVPWAALKITPAANVITLDATRETLDTSTVSPRNLQQLEQPQFARRIHDNFGTEIYWVVYGFAPAEEFGMSMVPWRADSEYNRRFDPAKIASIEGTIRSVGSYYPEKGAAAGISFTVESEDDELHTVYAGPRHFAAAKNIEFKTGSFVIVKGSEVTVEGKPVIMAGEVVCDGRTLKLYDKDGQPLWKFEEMEKKSQYEKQPVEKEIERETQEYMYSD